MFEGLSPIMSCGAMFMFVLAGLVAFELHKTFAERRVVQQLERLVSKR